MAKEPIEKQALEMDLEEQAKRLDIEERQQALESRKLQDELAQNATHWAASKKLRPRRKTKKRGGRPTR